MLWPPGAVTACEPPDNYVALGDSYTAGPLITPQDPAIPGCIRSDANYPNLVAPDLGLPAFRDVSCSGAQTRDMFTSQDVDPDPDNPDAPAGIYDVHSASEQLSSTGAPYSEW